MPADLRAGGGALVAPNEPLQFLEQPGLVGRLTVRRIRVNENQRR
jgi:hypothetical protein